MQQSRYLFENKRRRLIMVMNSIPKIGIAYLPEDKKIALYGNDFKSFLDVMVCNKNFWNTPERSYPFIESRSFENELTEDELLENIASYIIEFIFIKEEKEEYEWDNLKYYRYMWEMQFRTTRESLIFTNIDLNNEFVRKGFLFETDGECTPKRISINKLFEVLNRKYKEEVLPLIRKYFRKKRAFPMIEEYINEVFRLTEEGILFTLKIPKTFLDNGAFKSLVEFKNNNQPKTVQAEIKTNV